MKTLAESLADYLALRRSLGYKLERAAKLLAQFVGYLAAIGAETVTVEAALSWATQPRGADKSWWANRLSVVRGFARYLHTIDPATEVPAADLLPARSRRATPYLYSDNDIAALLAAAAALHSPLRVATYRTLIALLAVSGLRVGEAMRLDRSDLDLARGVLLVRDSKFGKSREVPLHPSTAAALHRYLGRADRPRPAATPALFISSAGTRLRYCNVQWTFARLVRRAGLAARSGSCRPRLHDLRHTFAVRAVLDGYTSGADVQARLPLLSTYLGHVDPAATYWYLSAAPELLALAGERLAQHLGQRP